MSKQWASRSRAGAPGFTGVSGEISHRAAVVEASSNLKSYLPAKIKQSDHEDVPGHSFSTVPARGISSTSPRLPMAAPQSAGEREQWLKKMEAQSRGSSAVAGGGGIKGISGSGAGTITTTYTPEASDKSTKIVFIQVMRESLDGAPVVPSTLDSSFAYQDADTTSAFHHVDYTSGEKDPYYNGDDPNDFGTQGNALTKVSAATTDTPGYDDANLPAGSTGMLYQFRTAAFSAAGADAGTYYGYSDWTYSKEKGKPEATATVGTGSGDPGGDFTTAVDLFNSNRGFTMPSSGLGAGAIAGIILGSVVGAAALGVGIAALAGAFN